jgi:hypothetical protein
MAFCTFVRKCTGVRGRAAGQAHLDPARSGVAIVLDQPVQQTVAEPEQAALPGALPAVKCGYARLERDVHDPPE